MPLKVALLENIFWTNGSYNKPATIPDSSKFETINVTPTMLSPFAGYVIITGDYNYAEFNGNLYFLSPVELEDQTKNKIKYLLTRDEWAFAVKNKTKVAGTVVKTLDERLLLENIQLTQPVILNPAKLNIVNLIETEEYPTTVIDPATLSFPEIYLSGRGVEALIEETDYEFASLNLSFKEGWKDLIIPYIEKFIKGVKDEKYMLAKVSQIESSFKFFWCLTPDDQAKRIGDTKERDVYIDKIDFSKLSDIKPLSIANHFNPAEANVKINLKNIGSSRIKSHDLELKRINNRIFITKGHEELINQQLIKFNNGYYIVNKQEETYLERILFPSRKEVWDKNLKTKGVEIERDLNLLDAKLRENRGHHLYDFYPATRNWIKAISPEFKSTEDLNPPLARKEDGTFDLEKIYEDYLSHIMGAKFDMTKSPFSVSWWIAFKSTRPRPKFFYEHFGTAYKALFVETKDNIQSLVLRIAGNAQSILRDPQIIKETIFNGWYKFVDETYEPPGDEGHEGKIYSIEKKDLETGMHLYDLVGTNYMLLIYKNEPHLIFQNAEIRAKGKRLSIKSQEQIPILDSFQTINQASYLQVFNKSFPLKDKITKDYEFNTEIKIITHPDSIGYDYAFIRHQGNFDNICEVIEYPKSKLAASAAVSAVEVENNYIAQQRNYEDLQLKRREASRKRSNEDLEWSFRWEEYNIKQANALVTFAVGLSSVGLAGGLGGISQVYAGLKGASKLTSGVAAFMNTGIEYRKLSEAQQNQLQARLLENYSLELTHHRYDYDLKRNLRNMGNVAQAAAVTYRDIMDKYNLEIGANEIHLRIWTPTELQMQTINALYQETGVDCLISKVTIQIDENLSGIWRFSVIDAIDSNDGMNISYLNSLLQSGVRIVPNDVVFKEPIKTIQSFLLPESVKRELGILKQKIEDSGTVERICKGLINYGDTLLIQEKEEEINELIREKNELCKISEEYFEQAKELKNELIDKEEQVAHLEQAQKELINNQEKLNQRIIQLYEAKEAYDETYKQAQANLERLNKDLSDLREEQVKEREKCEEQIKEAKDDIRKLRKDYDYKAEQLRNILRERNKFAEDNQQLKDELDKKQKDLEKEINDCNKKIQDKQQEIDQLNKNLDELKDKHTTKEKDYEEQIKEAKDDIRKLRKDYDYKAEQLRNILRERNKFAEDIVAKNQEIEQYKKKIEELQNKLNVATDLAKQIEEQKKQVEEQAKQLAQQKADIEKQLEEERKKQAPDQKIIKQYEDQLAEIKRKEKEQQDKLNQLQEELKEHETVKEQLGKANDCLIKYKKEYKGLYDKLKFAGQYYYFFLTQLNKLIASINTVLKELANNTWSNTKSWNWTTKFLVNDWLHEIFGRLGADQNLFVKAGHYLLPSKQIWTQKRLDLLTDRERFLWWILKEENIEEFTHYYGNSLRSTKWSSDLVITVDKFLSYSDNQVFGTGWIYTTILNSNYPAYSVKLYEEGTINTIIEAALQTFEKEKKLSQEETNWEKLSNDDKKNLFWKYIPKWDIPTPDELSKCIDYNLDPPAAKINIKETEEYKELKEEFEQEKADVYRHFNLKEEQWIHDKGELEEQLKQLQQTYNTCNNNLERYRTDYAELEKEKTTQENLANLYKAESDKLKTEKTQALKERDDARAELLTTKNYYKDKPIADIPANNQAKQVGGIGVGTNFYNMLKNAHYLKLNIDATITDYKNRVRSNQQTTANLGYYLNYMMDDIVRIMRPYIGDKESAFAYSKKIPVTRLQDIRQ